MFDFPKDRGRRTTLFYDAMGRTQQEIDGRTGATTYTYTADDQVETITRPAPEAGEAQLVTATFYDNLGRPIEERLADGTSTLREYFPSGELKKTSGSQTYPGSGVES